MFRIRKIFDDSTPANQSVIGQAQDILRAQFSMMTEAEIEKLPMQLRDPLRFRFRSVLFVAQGTADRVRGVAVLLHLSDVGACYLESLSTAPGISGRGIGAALYQRVREEARALDGIGLFFEALPDDPALSRDERIRRQNAERLKFYERFGARPIAGTAYETPLTEGGDNPPYLCFDPLDRPELPGRDIVRRTVRAVLERKYAGVCPPDYVDMVVEPAGGLLPNRPGDRGAGLPDAGRAGRRLPGPDPRRQRAAVLRRPLGGRQAAVARDARTATTRA